MNYFAMLETVKEKIRQLIAAYESERMERMKLQTELEQTRKQNEDYRTSPYCGSSVSRWCWSTAVARRSARP